jgi:hypothetical protein
MQELLRKGAHRGRLRVRRSPICVVCAGFTGPSWEELSDGASFLYLVSRGVSERLLFLAPITKCISSRLD